MGPGRPASHRSHSVTNSKIFLFGSKHLSGSCSPPERNRAGFGNGSFEPQTGTYDSTPRNLAGHGSRPQLAGWFQQLSPFSPSINCPAPVVWNITNSFAFSVVSKC